jgi:hypothetical protein
MDPKEILRQAIEEATAEVERLDEFRPKFCPRLEDQLEFLDRLGDQIIEQYTPTLQELNIDLTDAGLEQDLLALNGPEKSILGELGRYPAEKSLRAGFAYNQLHRFIKEAQKDKKSKAEKDKDSFEKAKDSFKIAMDLQWLQLAYLIHTFVPRWIAYGFDAEEDTGWLLFIGFVHGRLHAGSIDRGPDSHELPMEYSRRVKSSRDRRAKLRSCDHSPELKAYAQEKGNRLHEKHKWTRSKVANDLHTDDRLKHIPVPTLNSWLTDIPTKSRKK